MEAWHTIHSKRAKIGMIVCPSAQKATCGIHFA